MRVTGLLIAVCWLLMSCSGEQSTFSGYSTSAARVTQLTWILFVGGGVLMLLVVGLALVALFGRPTWRRALTGEGMVIWLGMVMPMVVLTALLLYGFVLLRIETLPYVEGQPLEGRSLDGRSFDGDVLRIHVVGEQWWWRVIYQHPDGSSTETANELRFPVGQPVELTLASADVIHSFWLPAYGGKVDMIPGRTNHLRFMPTHTGVTRGQCAEYCGGAHALMAFYAVAMPLEEYGEWLANERGDAQVRVDDPGAQAFLANGCGGCHTVRGTPADGVIGPDLTHIGSRLSIGAGILAADHAGFRQWLSRHQQIKPENLMPPYDILSEAEVVTLATYLVELK
jgi:cytochrome c oxidase subunit II